MIKAIMGVMLIIGLSQSNDKEVSDNGKALIKEFEGLKLKPYTCSGGQITIGYGHSNGRYSYITESSAEQLLDDDLKMVEKYLNKYDLNQSQFDAVASFIFNVGIGNFERSTFSKTWNPDELRKWVYANGEKLNGLIKRREAEIELFNNWYDAHIYKWYINETYKEFYIKGVNEDKDGNT